MRVTVLGAGSWGTTMASLVAGRHPTIVWARDPEVADGIRTNSHNPRYLSEFELPSTLDATDDLQKAVGQAELMIVGVPSHAFRETLEAAKPHVHPWIPIVSLTKGLEQGTLLRMTQIIREVLPGHPAAALTGPNIAREIMEGNAAASVVATEDLDVAGAIQCELQRGLLRIYTNHDVIGCELGGAVKNVIALGCGMAQGMGFGDNTVASLITRGLAGLGDLVATCASPLSRNRTFGERLGRGETLEEAQEALHGQVAEGVKSCRSVLDLAHRMVVDVPITAAVEAVCFRSLSPRTVAELLMSRSTKSEGR